MGKVAFVFAGQGAQYGGMGKSLCEASPAAAQVFAAADELRPGTSRQCFEGSAEQLSITKNTQPCMYCVDLAAGRALQEAGIAPDFVAGFSLGEIAALAFSGVFTPKEGFSFVCKRAEAMQEAAEKNPGSMAAVLKLTTSQVEELCAEFTNVWPVNYNCPGQLTVAGETKELEEFCKRAAEAGGRAVPLAVSGGFHSPLMEDASAALEAELRGYELHEPEMPVFANYTAKPYGGDMRELVVKQVKNPVHWQETIEALAELGVDTFIECGPGKTLSGLIKKTIKGANVLRVEDKETLEAAVRALKA